MTMTEHFIPRADFEKQLESIQPFMTQDRPWDVASMPVLPDGRSLPVESTVAWRIGRDNAADIESRLIANPGAVVVDIGSGHNVALADLQRRYPGIVPVGVDLFAQAEGRKGGYLMGGQAEALPLADNSADVVFSAFTYQYITDKLAAIAECYRVLRPGGLAAIELGSDEDGYTNPALSEIIRLAGLESELSVTVAGRDTKSDQDIYDLRIAKRATGSQIGWPVHYLGMADPADIENHGLSTVVSHYGQAG